MAVAAARASGNGVITTEKLETELSKINVEGKFYTNQGSGDDFKAGPNV